LLQHPQAQILLEDATLTAGAVRGCRDRLTRFLQRYLPCFYREEQRENARVVLEGRLSDLERKTSEPIAHQAGLQRKPVQHFVGAGAWDDEAVMTEIRRHVGEELADPQAVLVLDPSSFPKKGEASCGVQRQWCGRLGKIDNCQVGVFLTYAAAGGHAPLDRRLYLPRERARDRAHRQQCHVPPSVRFREKWQIGLDLVKGSRDLPHGWVTADDEFGRVAAFRARLRRWHERYAVDVPSNTAIRDLDQKPPRRRGRHGPRRKQRFVSVATWASRQPPTRWHEVEIRAGAKGPLRVKVLSARVQTRLGNRRTGPEERLLVIRTLEAKPKTHYVLSNAEAQVPLAEIVRAHAERHRIEEMFAEGKGEVGLDHYEVRSWVGWHHHMTLSLLALWFLVLEKRRVGGKNPGHHGGADARDLHAPAAPSSPQRGADRRSDLPRAAA
jgi:SRSO17 transposase